MLCYFYVKKKYKLNFYLYIYLIPKMRSQAFILKYFLIRPLCFLEKTISDLLQL